MVRAGTRRDHPCLVTVSAGGGHLCAGHSAVMKILTSEDALCAVFVSIPDGLPFSSLLSYSEVDFSDTFVLGCFLVPFILLC